MTGREVVSVLASLLLIVIAATGFWPAIPFAVLGVITLFRWRHRQPPSRIPRA